MAVINPMLNQPMDPFLQEQIEEERRYREGQEARRREENMADFSIQQQMRNQAAKERLEMELDARAKANRRSTRLQRKFQQQDLEAQRQYGRDQSALMAGELPAITDKIRTTNDMLRDMDSEILIHSAMGKEAPADAMRRTQFFNEKYLREAGIADVFNQTYGSQKGVSTQTTSDMQTALGNLAAKNPNNELVVDAYNKYMGAVGKEKQNILRTDSNLGSRYNNLVLQKKALQERQSFLIKNIGPGQVDYDSLGMGISSEPREMMPFAGGGSDGLGAFLDNKKEPLTNLPAGEAARRAYSESPYNVEEAFSGIDEMNDLLGNYDSAADNEEAFQKMLNAPASSPEDKQGQLESIIAEIEAREQALTDQFNVDYQEAEEDLFHWGIGNPFTDEVDTKQIDPTTEEVELMYNSQMGAYGTMKQRVYDKIEEVRNNPGAYGSTQTALPAQATIQGQGQSGNSLYMGGDPSAPIDVNSAPTARGIEGIEDANSTQLMGAMDRMEASGDLAPVPQTIQGSMSNTDLEQAEINLENSLDKLRRHEYQMNNYTDGDPQVQQALQEGLERLNEQVRMREDIVQQLRSMPPSRTVVR